MREDGRNLAHSLRHTHDTRAQHTQTSNTYLPEKLGSGSPGGPPHVCCTLCFCASKAQGPGQQCSQTPANLLMVAATTKFGLRKPRTERVFESCELNKSH